MLDIHALLSPKTQMQQSWRRVRGIHSGRSELSLSSRFVAVGGGNDIGVVVEEEKKEEEEVVEEEVVEEEVVEEEVVEERGRSLLPSSLLSVFSEEDSFDLIEDEEEEEEYSDSDVSSDASSDHSDGIDDRYPVRSSVSGPLNALPFSSSFPFYISEQAPSSSSFPIYHLQVSEAMFIHTVIILVSPCRFPSLPPPSLPPLLPLPSFIFPSFSFNTFSSPPPFPLTKKNKKRKVLLVLIPSCPSPSSSLSLPPSLLVSKMPSSLSARLKLDLCDS